MEKVTLREFWDSGYHKQMLNKINTFNSLKNTVFNYMYRVPKLKEYVSYGEKGNNSKVLYIEDILGFIKCINLNYSQYTRKPMVWGFITVDCYERIMRGYGCDGCYYRNLESLERCNIKGHVEFLLKTYGISDRILRKYGVCYLNDMLVQ